MWILFAVLGALAKAITSAIRKKLSNRNNAIYIFLSSGFTVVFFIFITLIIPGESLASLGNAPILLFWSGVATTVASITNMYAFKHEELSYITPMFALTPLYAAVVAFVTIGETPSTLGVVGILAIVIGVYVVTTSKGVSILDTFKRVARNRGARAGMLVPLAWAISATLNKGAINSGVTPMASLVAIVSVVVVAHLYILFVYNAEFIKTVTDWSYMKLVLLASLFGFGSIGFAVLALNGAFTSYALSIRRLDVLITVFIGWKFMGESNFARRISGALVMLFGALLISMSS